MGLQRRHVVPQAAGDRDHRPAMAPGDAGHPQRRLAAQALGADFAYIGSPWIATTEANAVEAYKQAIAKGTASDIVYTSLFTGVHGNYLRGSIIAAGLDPDNLPEGDPSVMNFGSGGNSAAKAWKDIWGAGQGIGAVSEVESVADRVEALAREYTEALAQLSGRSQGFPAWTI